MKWLSRILQGVLVVAFLMSGVVKLSGNALMLHDFKEIYGYSKGFMYLIGAFEILGAIGLIVGFWRSKIATFSSAGLAIIMIGAVFTHLSAGQDLNVAIAPFILLVLTLIILFSRRGNVK